MFSLYVLCTIAILAGAQREMPIIRAAHSFFQPTRAAHHTVLGSLCAHFTVSAKPPPSKLSCDQLF
jgi:hypothetical protein